MVVQRHSLQSTEYVQDTAYLQQVAVVCMATSKWYESTELFDVLQVTIIEPSTVTHTDTHVTRCNMCQLLQTSIKNETSAVGAAIWLQIKKLIFYDTATHTQLYMLSNIKNSNNNKHFKCPQPSVTKVHSDKTNLIKQCLAAYSHQFDTDA